MMHNHSIHAPRSHNGHSHKHGHGHRVHETSKKTLLLAIFLALGIALLEAIGGWWANSLALLSDAGHMAADSLSLVLAFVATWIASKPPSKQHSYGLGRAEVLGAWISSLLMVIVVIGLAINAIQRFHHAEHVSGGLVTIIAGIGIAANLLIAWLLSRGERTLNIRAASLHVIGDLLGSIAALVSGVVIYNTGWMMIDPILSIFICILILISSFFLLRETLLVLMEGVPPHLDLTEVGQSMAKTEHILAVHDLHIWTLSSGMIVLSAHVEIDDVTHWEITLNKLRDLLAESFGIAHVTIQPEILTHTLRRF